MNAWDQPGVETSEFVLTFESHVESSADEEESRHLFGDENSADLESQSVNMDISEGIPAGYVDRVATASSQKFRSKSEPRRVSLDVLNSSIEDGVVVTTAVVSIG